MNEDISFAEFLDARIKERGFTLKKLSELSGIAIKHLETMVRGDFSQLPPSPYFRGYIIKLGTVLDFDANVWWEKLRTDAPLKSSGEKDALPKNRFARQSHRNIIILVLVGVFVLLVIFIRLPAILGKPRITLTSLQGNPAVATSETVILEGTVVRADTLTINNDNVSIEPDGTWKKSVLLHPGPDNTFEIKATKTLGRQTTLIQQIDYEIPTPASETTVQPESTSQTSSVPRKK